MRLRYSFRFQQIGQTWLGSAVGQNAHLFNGVLQLNEVGHFIVSKLATPENPDNPETPDIPVNPESPAAIIAYLTDQLTKEYAVDAATAQSAVITVLDYLKAEQVLIP